MRTVIDRYSCIRLQHSQPAVNNGRHPGRSHGTATSAAAARCSVSAPSLQSQNEVTTQVLPALSVRQSPADMHLQQQPAQQPQQQHQQQAKQQLRPRPRPAEDVCRSISLHLKRADSAAQTLAVVATQGAQFNQINTALAYAQLARHLRFNTNEGRAAALSSSSYQQLQQLALQQAGCFSTRQVTMILTALAWMHGTGLEPENRRWQQQQQQQSPQQLPQQQQQQQHHYYQQQQQHQQCTGVSSLLGAATATSTAPEAAEETAAVADLAAALATRLQQSLDTAEPEDTCHCLWSISKLQLLRNPSCSELLISATAHGLKTGWIHTLTGKPLCSLLWVHAHFQQQQQQEEEVHLAGQQQQQQQQQLLLPDLVAAVMHECSQSGFMGTWTPQELSMLLWSCAVLKLDTKPAAAAAAAAAAANVLQQQQQQIVLPYDVLQQVCVLAVEQVVRFTPQGIANTCWALAKLLLAPANDSKQQQQWQQQLPQPVAQSVVSLFSTFTAAAAAQLQFYKPQEVANLLSACARLGLEAKPLTRAVSQYVINNSHLLNPRDVVELLVGFIELRAQPEACVVHALVHRLVQVLDRLEPYELAAAAWGLTKITAQGQGCRVSGAAAAANSRMAELEDQCVAAVHRVLDTAAAQVAAADAGHMQTAAAAAGGGGWQQLLANAGGRPLVMLLWAAAGSRYGSQQQQQQQQEEQQKRVQRISWLLRQVQQAVDTCSASTLVQILIALTRLHPQQQQQQQQQLVLAVSAAAEARLLPVLRQLPAEQVVWAAWAVMKIRATAAAAANSRGGSSSDPPSVAAASDMYCSDFMTSDDVDHKSLAKFNPNSPGLLNGRTATDFWSAAMDSLQQQQQQQELEQLPGHAVAALLHCCAKAGVTPSSSVLLPWLTAAEQQILQMSPQQQLLLLWSLAMLQQQQQQQQQSRLIRKLGEQLLLQVQQQLRFSSISAAASSSRKSKRYAHPSAAAAAARRPQQQQQQQQQHSLHGRELVALAAAYGELQPQLQQSDLLLAAVELWQQQQQQQQLAAVDVTAADVESGLHMLCVLSAPSAVGPPALTLQLPDLVQGVLLLLQQYLQQQQQQQQERVLLQPSLTTATAGAQAAAAAAAETEARILVLSLEALSRLRYQPPQLLLLLLNQRLLHCAAQIKQQQLVTAVHALVLLGLPVQQQLLAAAAAAARDHKQQQVLSYKLQLKLLWSILVTQYKQPTAAASSREIKHLARSVLHSSVVQQHQQLLQQQPRLLQMLMQCRQLLATQRYDAAGAAVLCAPDADVIRPSMLIEQLSALSKVMLGSQISPGSQIMSSSQINSGSGRRQQLVKLLQSNEQERLLVLQHCMQTSSSSNTDVAAVQQQQQKQLAAVMPLWIQQQLQQVALREVAQELKSAGVPAAALRYRHLANGDVALLVLAHKQTAADAVAGSSSSQGPAALAIVLESRCNRAVNSGKLLGFSLCRNYLLEDWGCRVVCMPLDCWLPAWVRDGVQERDVAQQQQQQQDQEQQVVAEQRKVLVERLMQGMV